MGTGQWQDPPMEREVAAQPVCMRIKIALCNVLLAFLGGLMFLRVSFFLMSQHPPVKGKVLEVLSPRVLDTVCVVGNCSVTTQPVGTECSKWFTDGTCWELDIGVTLQCNKACMRTVQARWSLGNGWIWDSDSDKHRCKDYQVGCLRQFHSVVGTDFAGVVDSGKIVKEHGDETFAVISFWLGLLMLMWGCVSAIASTLDICWFLVTQSPAT